MTTKHTPGPWLYRKVFHDGLHCLRLYNQPPDGFPSVVVGHLTPSIYQDEKDNQAELANARLVAAAPELLDVCRMVASSIAVDPVALMDAARAAIAKATD